jgi:hypothetical protein
LVLAGGERHGELVMRILVWHLDGTMLLPIVG